MRAGTKKGLINEGRWKLLIFLIETYVVFVMIEFKKRKWTKGKLRGPEESKHWFKLFFCLLKGAPLKKRLSVCSFRLACVTMQRDCYLAWRAKFWQTKCEAVRIMEKTRSRGSIKTSRVCQSPFRWWKWLIKQGSVATKKDIALIRIHKLHKHWPGCWLPAALIHIHRCICINMQWNKICS